jgi:hypothetical protein
MGDWVKLKRMVEFANNNRSTTSPRFALFFVNTGFHPHRAMMQLRTHILADSSEAYGHWMTAIHDDCDDTLTKTHKVMTRSADRDRAEPAKYSTGDSVLLSGNNIRPSRPCEKITLNYIAPSKLQKLSRK